MASIFEEIRQQPYHIREVFLWLFVVVTFSVIGFFWFRSTQQQVLALINPDSVQAAGDSHSYAITTKNESPFKTVLDSFRGLQANISQLVNFKNNDVTITNDTQVSAPLSGQAQYLPVTKDRPLPTLPQSK